MSKTGEVEGTPPGDPPTLQELGLRLDVAPPAGPALPAAKNVPADGWVTPDRLSMDPRARRVAAKLLPQIVGTFRLGTVGPLTLYGRGGPLPTPTMIDSQVVPIYLADPAGPGGQIRVVREAEWRGVFGIPARSANLPFKDLLKGTPPPNRRRARASPRAFWFKRYCAGRRPPRPRPNPRPRRTPEVAKAVGRRPPYTRGVPFHGSRGTSRD